MHGELAFFDLRDLHLIQKESLLGWATACELVPSGNGLLVADNESGALLLYGLSEFGLLTHVSIAGTPTDLRVARSSATGHLITNNSRYYRFPLSTFDPDTMFTGENPRRIRMRPIGDQSAWIACRGDSTVRAIKEQGFFEEMSISFPSPCTDVAFSPDGLLAYCAVPGNDAIYVLDAGTGIFVDSLNFNSTIVDLCMSQQGHYLLAVDSADGDAKLFDLEHGIDESMNFGDSAIRPGFSVSSHAFFVICPAESRVLRLDPFVSPPRVTDTLDVDPIPQCLSFLE